MKRVPVTFALVNLFALSPLLAQDDKPKPPDKEVADKLEVLDDVVGHKKFERDAEGVQVIDVLLQKHKDGLNPKDQEQIVKGLEAAFLKGKRRPHDQIALYEAAAYALGDFGASGAKVLKNAYTKNRFPDKPEWVPLRERLLKAIGRTKDESMVKFLIDEARRSPEAALQAAAGEALGNFDESKEEVRKEIVDNLLIKWGELAELESQLGTNIEAQNARDRLAAISDKWNTTLSKLTKQNFTAFRDWQSWHNKNKNKPW